MTRAQQLGAKRPDGVVEGYIEKWATQPGRLGICARYAYVLEEALAERNATIDGLVKLLRECKDALYEDPQDNWVDLVCDIQNAINRVEKPV